MSYLNSIDDFVGRIPREDAVAALDDDRDGVADTAAWDALVATVQREIDGRIGRRYSLPLPAPVPPMIISAALTFGLLFLHERRGLYGDANPLSQAAAETRRLLDRIGSGTDNLEASRESAEDSVLLIGHDSVVYQPGSRLAT